MWGFITSILFLGVLAEIYWILIPIILFIVGICSGSFIGGLILGIVSLVILYGIHKHNQENT